MVYGISQELLKLKHYVIYQSKACVLVSGTWMKFDLKREQIKHLMFHFYFMNSYILLIIELTVIKLYTNVKNI